MSAPIHFTDGSEATVVSARGITVQVRLPLLSVSLERIGPLTALTIPQATAAAFCAAVRKYMVP